MSDAQKQIAEKFTGTYRNMRLEVEGQDDSILLTILNVTSLETFQQTIDGKFLKTYPEFGFLFESPKELMLYIINHFQKMAITTDGEVRFQVTISGSRKPKLMNLKIDKKPIDRTETLNLKLESFRETTQMQIKKVKDELQVERKSIKQQMLKKDEQINQLMQVVAQLQRQSQRQNDYIYKLHPAHLSSRSNTCFTTRTLQNSILVTHLTDDGDYTFLFRDQIKPGMKKLFKTRLVRVPSYFIGFGFHTKTIFENPDVSIESISYCSDGYVQNGDESTKTGHPLKGGDRMDCEIDLIENKAHWAKNGSKVFTLDLPEKMRNQSLYFALYMKAKHCQVELFLD